MKRINWEAARWAGIWLLFVIGSVGSLALALSLIGLAFWGLSLLGPGFVMTGAVLVALGLVFLTLYFMADEQIREEKQEGTQDENE